MGRRGASKLRLKKPRTESGRAAAAGAVTSLDSDDDFQITSEPRSTRARRSAKVLSQEEQEEEDIALAIAASLSDRQGDAAAGAEEADVVAARSVAEPSHNVEALDDSDEETLQNASEEMDFDAVSDEDAYEDEDDEDDEDDEESEGEEEADWQADEEEDNPTGFGKCKSNEAKRKAAAPKREAAHQVAPGNCKKVVREQKAPVAACTTSNAGVDDSADVPTVPSTTTRLSPAVSQLTSPANPAACPIAVTTAGAAAIVPVAQDNLPLAQHTPSSVVADTAAKMTAKNVDQAVLQPNAGNGTRKISIKQAPRHTGLPSGYKDQAAWAVQSAGLKRPNNGRGGATIRVGGGRGIKGLGKSRAPTAGLKRGIKGRTSFIGPKPTSKG